MNKISIIGMGYIGLPTALLLAGSKNKVICVDKNKEKISDLKSGKVFLKEKSIQSLFKKKKKYLDFSNTIKTSNIYIICVPTPVKRVSKYSYKEDLSFLNSVLKELEKKLKKNDLVIIESTCPPKTASKFYNKIRNFFFFYLATCPERAMPGSTINEMVNNYRVIGASCNETFKKTKNLYRSFVKGKIYQTGLIEAELIKLFENSYRDTNIALAHEIDTISKYYKIDSKKIINLANFHPRVNILQPGIGVGGHCVPVDPWFLIKKNNVRKNSIIYKSRIINIKKEIEIYNYLLKILDKNKKILFFGTTYKKNTDDIRNSPAINIIKKLKKKFLKANIYDPMNDIYNNISLKKIKSTTFDIIVVFVHHNWLNKNKIKNKRAILL